MRLLVLLLLTATAAWGQQSVVTLSGEVRDLSTAAALPYASVVLRQGADSAFVTGTVTNEDGRFTLPQVKPGKYMLEVTSLGYKSAVEEVFVGTLSPYLDVGVLSIEEEGTTVGDVVITARQTGVSDRMDKQSYAVDDNLTQAGGSVLQAMQVLPGVTVSDGKVLLRGNDKVVVLINGKQSALTGFGSQSGLDNLPASAIERIEIITNPSSKYDANGNAGIINIILRKDSQDGFSGKVGIAAGLGALWVRKENLPGIRPQYRLSPKVNPSLFLNWRKDKLNLFVQADNLYTQTLNKNEFVTRTYDDGTVVRQQLKRNRNTDFLTTKAGMDWSWNAQNTLTLSGTYGKEWIIDRGDEPFYNADLSEQLRLWQFLEDEVKTTVMGVAGYQHRFKAPGHTLSAGFSYTFHREDEKYFFDNTLPQTFSRDAFALISDEHVADFTLDYVRPLKHGRFEGGLKFRRRTIPTNMDFIPGQFSVLDTAAGGWATYKETIPAAYGTYVLETKRMEAELGLRVEYVGLQYEVNPDHPTYRSDGYSYAQPFPNLRLAYKVDDRNKFSAFYSRRVDRPNEVDIRIFPKYDDAEIIKVGNPGLQPQFTNAFEVGYKSTWKRGYLYAAAYHRLGNGTITRISVTQPGSNLIYAVFQNAGRSTNTGMEVQVSRELGKWYSGTLSLNGYRNEIDSFSVLTLYPVSSSFFAARQSILSGNIKLNNNLQLPGKVQLQCAITYMAPDLIPQGKIAARFTVDLGAKRSIQSGKGELFLNATDLFGTLVIQKEVFGDGFQYTSADYYETQAVRLGWSYRF